MDIEIVVLSEALLAEVAGCDSLNFHHVNALDLHLRGNRKGKIRRIENLWLLPNLLQLNLSYNIITKIEGLDRLGSLVELNLAENSISRIEGIEHLKCLERLNLSGNRIQRIPETIGHLSNLVHFRVARNRLNEVTDLRFLGKLEKLRNLRLDDNPIMKQEFQSTADTATSKNPSVHSVLFAIFYIKSLTSINGDEISNRQRNEARRCFATDELTDLKSQLAAEQHQLLGLKRDLKHSPERAAAFRSVDISEPPEELDERNRALAAKLDLIEKQEQLVDNIRGRLRSLEQHPHSDSPNPIENQFQRLHGDSATPARSLVTPHTPPDMLVRSSPSNDLASQHFSEMNARVERLASRALSAEADKHELQQQLEVQRMSLASSRELQLELDNCQAKLGEALQAVQDAHGQLQQRETDLSAAERSLAANAQVIAVLEAQLRLSRDDQDILKKDLYFLKTQERPRVSNAKEDWKTQDSKAELLKLRMVVDDLTAKNEYLSKELEERLRQAAQLTDSLVRAQQDAERWKHQLSNLQSDAERKVSALEAEQTTNRKLVRDLTNDLNTLQNERDQLITSLRLAESDLQSMINVRKSPNRHIVGASRNLKESRRSKRQDVASTDSEDAVDSPHSHSKRKAGFSNRQFVENLTTVERRAAAIMAHTIVEELHQSKVNSAQAATTQSDALQASCVRAVLRILGSSRSAGTDTDAEVSPLRLLGDRDTLSRLVSDCCSNMATLEDSDAIREEIHQLEVIVRELESKAEELDRSIGEKQTALKALERHGSEARKQAEGALSELEQMAQRLQSHRSDLLQLNAQQQLTQREVEINKTSLQEMNSIHQLEMSSLQSVRDKILQAKQELSSVEQQLSTQRELVRKEEQKIKNLKYVAQEQLQSLQQEVASLQSAAVLKQQSVDELEAVRKRFDEELDSRQRDVYYQKQLLAQQINEETQRLQQLKNDTKLAHLGCDQLLGRQRHLEAEVARLHEQLDAETGRLEFVKLESSKKTEVCEKQVHHVERHLKVLKDSKLALENDQVLLAHSVEELRRQQYDMEKAQEQRQKTAEADLVALQQQILTNQRLVKQLAQQRDQKQHEVDMLVHTQHSLEAKLSDGKKLALQQEEATHQHRDVLRQLEQSASALQKTVLDMKRDHETLRGESLALKALIQADQSQHGELKRRVGLLLKEEETIAMHENQIKLTLQGLKLQVEDLRTEHDQLVAANDRDSYILKELASKKLHLENEISRLEQLLGAHKERLGSEHLRNDEASHKAKQAVEELHKVQKEVLAMEQKLRNYEEKQQHFDLQEQAHKSSFQKLSMESEATREQYHKEKLLLDRLRDDQRQVNLALSRSREELAFVEHDLQSKRAVVDQSKVQHNQLDQQKLASQQELQQVREAAEREQRRLENVQEACAGAERRLEKLRTDLSKAEESVESTLLRSKEEKQKVDQYQELLSSSMQELRSVENSINAERSKLHTERQRAVEDMGLLNQAKSSARAEIVKLEETKRELSRPALHREKHFQPLRAAEQSTVTALVRPPLAPINSLLREYPAVPPQPIQSVAADFRALNSSNVQISDDSSVGEAAPALSLQHAVEMLRRQSTAALAAIH